MYKDTIELQKAWIRGLQRYKKKLADIRKQKIAWHHIPNDLAEVEGYLSSLDDYLEEKERFN